MSEQCQRHHESYARDFCLTHDSFYVYDDDDLCTHARAVTAEATIKRVRELADTWLSDGASWGPHTARCILRALDGEQ